MSYAATVHARRRCDLDDEIRHAWQRRPSSGAWYAVKQVLERYGAVLADEGRAAERVVEDEVPFFVVNASFGRRWRDVVDPFEPTR